MEDAKLSEQSKKNILDLQYAKYLQYFNTSIIIIFTYFIGLVIALFTKQINLADIRHLFLLVLASSLFLIVIIYLLLRFKYRMKNVIEEIKKLNL